MKIFRKTIFFISWICLILCGCAQMWQTKVDFASISNQVNLRKWRFNPNAPIELVAPVVTASRGYYVDTIHVAWDSVYGAESYNVYRAVMSDGAAPTEDDFELLPSTYVLYRDDVILASSEKISNPLSPEYKQKCYYKVAAVKEGEEGPMSEIAEGYIFAPPFGGKASVAKFDDRISLTWASNPDAVEYVVYRSRTPGDEKGEYGEIARTTSNRYDDSSKEVSEVNANKDFFYKIAAISRNRAESCKSESMMGSTKIAGAASEVTGVKASRAADKNSVLLSWDAIDAENVTGLNIYRSDDVSSALKKIAQGLDGASSSFSDSSAEANRIYAYYLQVESIVEGFAEPVKSGLSNDALSADELAEAYIADKSLSEIEFAGYILSPPKDPVAQAFYEGGAKKTRLKFSLPLGADGGWTYEYEHSDSTTSWTGAGTAFSNGDVIDLSQGFYKFRSKSAEGKESNWTEFFETAPLPVTSVTVKQVGPKQDSKVVDLGGIYPVDISWESVEGAASYTVYRSAKKTSGFLALGDAVAGTSFRDTTEQRAGTVYYYKVMSNPQSGKGAFSEDSACVEGWGALTPEKFFLVMQETTDTSHKKLTYMNKKNDLDKLGTETKNGSISGTVYYNAETSGLGAEIEIKYTNYCDHQDSAKTRPRMVLDGNSDTSANMSANGSMHGTITVTGMYRGTVDYGHIEIKGGAAGGGYYGVKVLSSDGSSTLAEGSASWVLSS